MCQLLVSNEFGSLLIDIAEHNPQSPSNMIELEVSKKVFIMMMVIQLIQYRNRSGHRELSFSSTKLNHTYDNNLDPLAVLSYVDSHYAMTTLISTTFRY